MAYFIVGDEEEKNNETRTGARVRALSGLHHQLFHHASKMSCAAEDIKRKVVSAGLFQTPKRQEASAFGAFNSFFVLPIGVLVYAILLKTAFNPIESETEMIVTKNYHDFISLVGVFLDLSLIHI